MRRIDEIRERLDKARPGLGEIDGGEELLKRRGNPKGLYTWTLYGTYADAILLVNARNDLAWLLDALARRDQRCEDLAVSLDETRASLDAAIAAHDRELREQIEQQMIERAYFHIAWEKGLTIVPAGHGRAKVPPHWVEAATARLTPYLDIIRGEGSE